MERNLGRFLASRGVFVAVLAVVAYYMIPSSGVSQFKEMNAALQNARSWRVRTILNEPTRSSETTTEVYCPDRVHTAMKMTLDEGGRHIEDESETIFITGSLYTKKGWRWVLSQEDRYVTASCSWGPRGSDEALGKMDFILRIGKIRKGDKRVVGGDRCRDWIASIPAPAGWRDSFGVCIGDDHLPREVFTPDRSQVSTYSDWNAPIKIEAPDSTEVTVQ